MGIFYNKTTFKVHRDAQEIPVKAKVDVLVCGGGPAGIGAALGAAKGEVSVMIIEKNNCLGGLATTGLVTTFAGSSIFSDSEDDDPTVNRRQVIKGVVWEFIERLIQEDGAISPEELNKTGQNDAATFDIEVYKRVADEIMEEWGINLLYHTMITGAIMDGETIKGVVIENKAGCQAILADVIIDATGDGDVMRMEKLSHLQRCFGLVECQKLEKSRLKNSPNTPKERYNHISCSGKHQNLYMDMFAYSEHRVKANTDVK